MLNCSFKDLQCEVFSGYLDFWFIVVKLPCLYDSHFFLLVKALAKDILELYVVVFLAEFLTIFDERWEDYAFNNCLFSWAHMVLS